MEFTDILRPYKRLIEIDILGEKQEVPENNSLLRCFQFLSPETVSYSDLCWNGTCTDCQVWVRNGDKEKAVLACRTDVQEGMEIVRVAPAIELK
ncbi:MAG: 2Fe-2S iron-sulfur cluster-binding protein [Pyrinomonadaceae bacterium]